MFCFKGGRDGFASEWVFPVFVVLFASGASVVVGCVSAVHDFVGGMQFVLVFDVSLDLSR